MQIRLDLRPATSSDIRPFTTRRAYETAPRDPVLRADAVRRRLAFDADPAAFCERYAEVIQRRWPSCSVPVAGRKYSSLPRALVLSCSSIACGRFASRRRDRCSFVSLPPIGRYSIMAFAPT